MGGWAPEMYGEIVKNLLRVERRVLFWMKPKNGVAPFNDIPVYIWQYDSGGGTQGSAFYGFPTQPGFEPGGSLKVARHGLGERGTGGTKDNLVCSPDTIDREVEEGEILLMKEVLERTIPELAGDLVRTETCMYTMTPNEDFLIDWNGDKKTTLFVSPCSGHGFKMASGIGEISADLCETGTASFDIDFMKMTELEKEL